MIKSMTGFGSHRRADEEFVVDVDLRSVNNKFLKISLKAPEALSRHKMVFEDLIKARISRGTVDITLKLMRNEGGSNYNVRESVVESYIAQLNDLKEKTGVPGEIDLALLLSLPGSVESSISVDDEELGARLRELATATATEALDQLAEMRIKEGEALFSELSGILDELDEGATRVETHRSDLLRDYRDRLFGRVQELLQDSGANLAEDALLREVSIFAERSDVAEELQRLRSHLIQFRETCERDESVGRRLEFIVQEMHREVNTMGSKSNDSSVAALVLDMKGLVDRLREQCLNIE
ncbi:MAG: YicC/YloC family endoribonuclease [Planctomycetota bacterium]|nr:YicC/YloC family endoribonuclease [Planctomycetota bacterium]MDP7249357.1 YicC/YloC family endoribonuclease [Planctomycetota bacterium]